MVSRQGRMVMSSSCLIEMVMSSSCLIEVFRPEFCLSKLAHIDSVRWRKNGEYVTSLLKPLRFAILVSPVFCLSKFAHTGSVRWVKNGEHVPSPPALGSFLFGIRVLNSYLLRWGVLWLIWWFKFEFMFMVRFEFRPAIWQFVLMCDLMSCVDLWDSNLSIKTWRDIESFD